ncbi:MAG: universal stress protein [Planctomycetes bacterium]|nr:universal stress protein [Planctomycetota bacterium]
MFRSILVPLDRSSFAEHALPMALGIARRVDARLELVEVHESERKATGAGWARFSRERDDETKQQEQLYLEATAKWATAGSQVTTSAVVMSGTAVLPETVADAILERCSATNANLIVMATHGLRFLVGGVADQLVGRAHVPIILLRPGTSEPQLAPETLPDNFLIPLDGTAMAEGVLVPAVELARIAEARCTLVQVVEPRSAPVEAADAEAYLERVAERVRREGLEVRTKVVVARDTSVAILDEARAGSLIAIATHGRSGLTRLVRGSVAARVIRETSSPILVFRPTSANG